MFLLLKKLVNFCYKYKSYISGLVSYLKILQPKLNLYKKEIPNSFHKIIVLLTNDYLIILPPIKISIVWF